MLLLISIKYDVCC